VRDLIRGMGRPALRLLRRDERGVVAVLVGVLVGGVLLGLGAVVIDVGQLYQERAELQNGADAAALAVARSCATGVCTASGALTTAGTEANGNASALTGGTEAASVCGSGAGDTLTACGTPGTAMTSCPANPTGFNYVDVSTSTKTSGGATVIAPVFGKELTGNGSSTGTAVQACAQAEWGGALPNGSLITAFTISACEWYAATTNGTVFAQPPPYPPSTAPSSTLDRVIKLRSTGTGTGCTKYPAPADAVSKFGWITETGGCSLNNITGTTYGVNNSGSSSSPNCNTPLFDDAQNKSLIYVPVYTSVTGSGATAVYNLLGVAAFVVTGYNIPGSTFNKYTDWLKSTNQCTGTTYCINGYFVQADFSGGGTIFSTNDEGLYAINLTG
jgi:Flp pilus assembly protein TadG